jgi:hypothetical protein
MPYGRTPCGECPVILLGVLTIFKVLFNFICFDEMFKECRVAASSLKGLGMANTGFSHSLPA